MEISSDNMLGAPDKGFKQFLKTLTGGKKELQLYHLVFVKLHIRQH